LRVGDSGKEVSALVKALVREGLLMGSPGEDVRNEFDEEIASYIVEFQEKYASEILAPNGLKHGTGYVASATRKKLNALYGCKIEPKACTQDAKQCSDGSYVSRSGPNCEFAQCPKTQCTIDSDCPQPNCINAATGATPNCIGSNFKCIEGKCVPSTTTCPIGCTCSGNIVSCSNQSIRVISPNGGETYKIGDTITVNWKTVGVSTSETLSIIRLRAYPYGQEYNLAYNVVNDGQEVITLPSSVPVGAYTLEIKTYVNNVLVFDASDSYFKIVPLVVQCSSDADCPTMCPTCVSGSSTACGQCIISKCVDGKCVSQTQPVGALNVSLDGGTPVSQSLNLGQTNVIFARIQLTNPTNTAISNMNSIQVASNSSVASSKVINIKIYDDSTNTQIGNMAISLTNNGSYYYVWVNISGFSIPAYTTKALRIVADVKTDSATGQINLGIAGFNFNQPGCITTGMPVYGNNMTIVSNTTQPSITVTSPNGGEQWTSGTPQNISWTSIGLSTSATTTLELTSYDSNGGFIRSVAIANQIPVSQGSYSWTVPSPTTGVAKYKIFFSNVNAVNAPSGFFTIVASTVGLNVSQSSLASISDVLKTIAQQIQALLAR
jgi:hypothetical protein